MAQRILARPTGFVIAARKSHYSRKFSTVVDGPVSFKNERISSSTTQSSSSVFQNALDATGPRTSWTKEEISEVYNTSLIDLTYASVC
jgi:biotin synthase